MRDHWGQDDVAEYVYYLYMSENRMFTYQSKECVSERLGHMYHTLKAKYDGDEDSSSSSSSSGLSWLIVGSAWILIG